MMKHLLQILLLSILFSSTGCSSIINLTESDSEGQRVYGGTRWDLKVIESAFIPSKMDLSGVLAPFAIIDLPFSAVVDTAALSFTIPYYLMNERQHGNYCERRCTESYINDTQITNARLKHPKKLTKIHVLHLKGTQVTDAGLENLKGLINLDYLHLKSTQVTDEGLERLRKALPNCMILK